MRKLRSLTFALGLAFAPPAMAAEGSIGLTAGSGTNAGLTAADGAGFVSFLHAICGGASGTMGTACANQVQVNSSGQILVDVANTSLAVTGTFWQTTQPVSGTFWQTTQPVSLSAFPGTAGLATIGGSAPSGTAPVVIIGNTNPNGQTTMSASSPVAIASDQSAVATKAASGTFVAGSIADLAHGQGTMAASVPVAIASNQSSVPVTGTFWQTTQPVSEASPYPATAVPITASATGTTTATTATLTNVSGHTTYICGFSIRANATAAATGMPP